jgi:hypothetical protein
MEVWETPAKEHFVRVLHEGTPKTSYEWIPLDKFIQMLDSQIIENIYKACTQ